MMVSAVSSQQRVYSPPCRVRPCAPRPGPSGRGARPSSRPGGVRRSERAPLARVREACPGPSARARARDAAPRPPPRGERTAEFGARRGGGCGDPADIGHWAAPFSIPVMAVHAAMLPTGKVMWSFVSEEPERPPRRRRSRLSEHRAGVAVGSRHGPEQARGSAAVARPRGRSAEAGQHLVRRAVLHGRRAGAGDRRQPALQQRTRATSRA